MRTPEEKGPLSQLNEAHMGSQTLRQQATGHILCGMGNIHNSDILTELFLGDEDIMNS